jgi:hypothetical protein
MSAGGMSAGGMGTHHVYRSRITWREVPGIYKARFRRLWQVMRLSLLAAILLFSTVVLLPLLFGAAFFSGHFLLTAIAVGVVLFVAGWLYWMSLKLAFESWKGR